MEKKMEWFRSVTLALIAIFSIFAAGYLAMQGIEGWGWFIFLAFFAIIGIA
jgi:hypothetical protein